MVQLRRLARMRLLSQAIFPPRMVATAFPSRRPELPALCGRTEARQPTYAPLQTHIATAESVLIEEITERSKSVIDLS